MHREHIEEIAYNIRRTRQAKRLTLRISHNGEVSISIPHYASLKQARSFLHDNLPYVRARLKEVEQRRHSVLNSMQEVECPVKGVWLPVQFRQDSSPAVDIRSSSIVISYPRQQSEVDQRVESLQFWCATTISQAQTELPQRTLELATTVKETVKRITVRDQKSRWGSCSARTRSINLNWRCVLFPDDVRDYLIYHELAHLRHANHSDAYWSLVEKWNPTYREAEQWISTHEQRLMTFTRDILSIGS